MSRYQSNPCVGIEASSE